MPRLRDILRTEGIDPLQLIGPAEQPACDKYDNYIPADLLRRAYATDRLSPEEVMLRLASDTPFPQETI